MVKAWERVWKKTDVDIEISEGEIFDGPVTDAIISPSNSFGFLNGGIDAVYSRRWPHLQAKLQQELAENHFGELPVGSATIVRIHAEPRDDDFNWLISAPTMRVPLDVRGTVNAYLAFRAALIEVIRHTGGPSIHTILCPGLGTAVGMVPYLIAAVQMYAAWKYLFVEALDVDDDLGLAWQNHEYLRRGVI